jgi:hypothetical protein
MPRAAVLVLLALEACSDCDKKVYASVGLDVRDEGGDPVLEATARYRVDGGDWAPCDDNSSAQDSWFVCGWDEVGAFDLEVSAPGFATWTLSVMVEPDGCHARSLGYDVVLLPEG